MRFLAHQEEFEIFELSKNCSCSTIRTLSDRWQRQPALCFCCQSAGLASLAYFVAAQPSWSVDAKVHTASCGNGSAFVNHNGLTRWAW